MPSCYSNRPSSPDAFSSPGHAGFYHKEDMRRQRNSQRQSQFIFFRKELPCAHVQLVSDLRFAWVENLTELLESRIVRLLLQLGTQRLIHLVGVFQSNNDFLSTQTIFHLGRLLRIPILQ